MDLHKIIHGALNEFIHSYIPDADLRWAIPSSAVLQRFYHSVIHSSHFSHFSCSTLDDVLLSYITGVLEDLGSQQSVEENFDVEVFAEMLEAYIPGFAEIDRWTLQKHSASDKQQVRRKSVTHLLLFFFFLNSQRQSLWDDVQPGLKISHGSDLR